MNEALNSAGDGTAARTGRNGRPVLSIRWGAGIKNFTVSRPDTDTRPQQLQNGAIHSREGVRPGE